MLHPRVRDENARPAATPRPVAQVEILHVGGIVSLVDTAERSELGGVIERAAAASVEHVAEVLAGEWQIAAHRKIGGSVLPVIGFPRFFAANSRRKEYLRRGAKKF